MGPTSGADVRLPARRSAGKALGEMARIEASPNPPGRGDRGEGLEDEAALAELRMGDSQAPRAEPPAAPQDDVEVEHAWAPALARAPSELVFDRLEAAQHLRR